MGIISFWAFLIFLLVPRSDRKHVFEVPISYCVRERRAENGCPSSATCENEPFKPLCGSDGHIYDSECDLRLMNCGWVKKSFNDPDSVLIRYPLLIAINKIFIGTTDLLFSLSLISYLSDTLKGTVLISFAFWIDFCNLLLKALSCISYELKKLLNCSKTAWE